MTLNKSLSGFLCASFIALSAPIALAQQPEKPGHVHTSRKLAKKLPLPKSKDAWHFVIFGDRTGGAPGGLRILKQATKDTNLLDPDLVMTVGDLVQGYNTTKSWLKEAKEYSNIMNSLKMPWYPVAGNHDMYWRGAKKPKTQHEKNYEKHFGPLWYWFPHKNAAFIVLFTDEGNPKTGSKSFKDPDDLKMSQQQLAWLKETVTKTKKYDHVFVLMHHPRWDKKRYGPNNWEIAHKMLVAAGNVTAVFAGHIHRMKYDGKRDGIEYHIVGSTGAVLEFDLPQAGFLHQIDLVSVQKKKISVSGLPVGVLIDPKTMPTEMERDISLLMRRTLQSFDKPMHFSYEKPHFGFLNVTVKNPTTRAIDVTLQAKTENSPWRFVIDHAHSKIPAQKSATFKFRYALHVKKLIGVYDYPKFTTHIEYLAADRRITLPDREVNIPITLKTPADQITTTKVDKALLLDGRGSCLKISADAIKSLEGPMTIEGWVWQDHFRRWNPLFSNTQSSGYGIDLNYGTVRFKINFDGQYAVVKAPKPIESSQWHHVAGVFDGVEMRLYINGKLVGKSTTSGKRKHNKFPLYVGAEPNRRGKPTDFIKAFINEVRFSSASRYKDDFTPSKRHENDAQTSVLLHLDQHIGPFLIDHSSNNKHPAKRGRTRCLLPPK
jgi:hypothetical protein